MNAYALAAFIILETITVTIGVAAIMHIKWRIKKRVERLAKKLSGE